MIERAPGGALATFQLETWPPSSPEERVAGKASFDHRAVYLAYEGEISGNRGHVRIVERGELEDRSGDLDGSFESDVLRIEREGERVLVDAWRGTSYHGPRTRGSSS